LARLPQFLQDIATQLEHLWKEGQAVPTFPQSRMSRQPFCPRAMYYDFNDKTAEAEFSWSSDLILSVGTAIHEVMQRWIPLKIETFGNWVCDGGNSPRSGCGYKTKEPVWHKGLCPKCKREMLTYVELEFRDKRLGQVFQDGDQWIEHPHTGHCDGVWRWEDLIILVDYKTTTPESLKFMCGYPSYSHQTQTTIYAEKLLAQYNLKTDFIVVFYINRDVSTRRFNWELMCLEPDWALYETYARAIEYGWKCIRNNKVPRWGICHSTANTYFCPHTDRCFANCDSPASRNSKVADILSGGESEGLSDALGKWDLGGGDNSGY